MLRTNLKKVIFSRVFWGTVLLFAAIMVLGVFNDLPMTKNNSISVLYFYETTSSVGIAHVLAPIITIMPFTFFYVEELEKKAIYYTLIRSSKRNYYLSHIVTAISSSILVAAFAMLLFVIICLGFGANFTLDPMMSDYYAKTFFGSWLENGQVLSVFLIKITAFLMFSMPFGLVSLAVSIFSKNKYIIIASPFILFMAASYITEMTSLHFLNPGVMLLKGFMLNLPYGGLIYATIYQGILILFFSAFYYGMSKRRFHYEGI